MDPPQGPIIYTIGVLESRIGAAFLDPSRALGKCWIGVRYEAGLGLMLK